jgi:hypothetical protein
MIISSYYNSKTGKTARLEADLNSDFFPRRYIVTNAKNEKEYFFPSESGARKARIYYENITNVYECESDRS